ncbi:MAG: hypothetical protein LR001_02780 [Clostridiales bacterium]|nr:hypothetical protein [Clostridiales bacterium]
MIKIRRVDLDMTEENKYLIIKKLVETNGNKKRAAVALDLSERQIYRLKKGVKAEGAAFFVHKNTNNKPSHTLDDDFKQKIIRFKNSDDYKGANFSHSKDLIWDKYKIYSALI